MYKFGRTALVLVCVGFLASCVAPTFNMPVKKPAVSSIKYDTVSNQPNQVSMIDSRPAESLFSEGVLNFDIKVEGEKVNEVEFFSAAIIDELKSRGSLVSLAPESQGDSKLEILTLKIVNHRVNAYSPLVTFTQFSGDFLVDGKVSRIVSFIKRGKVPIWAINEKGIVENVFNQPLSLLAQDVATRITQNLSSNKISDAAVEALAIEASDNANKDPLRYMKVYQLGFGNNASAIPHLVKLVDNSHEYVRLAAISSLGLLHATSEVERLTQIFKSAKLWQDRGMALKALADLDTPESKKVVDAEWDRIASLKRLTKSAKWNKEILSLYR